MPMCRSPPFLSKNAEKKKWFDIIIKMTKGVKQYGRYFSKPGN